MSDQCLSFLFWEKNILFICHYILTGHGKDKPWKCMACDKAYIGKAGLARHYRLAPDHGKDDENFKDIGT